MSGSARIAPLSRDQAIVLASLSAITVLAWLYLIDMARGMSPGAMGGMPGMAMPTQAIAMSPMSGSFVIAAIMWVVMMVGMMLPSAMPMILLFTTVQRNQGQGTPRTRSWGPRCRPVLMSGLFAGGYLLVWGGFSIAAAGLQIALQQTSLLSPGLALTDARITGAAFLLAAAFEISPLKNRCLTHCRTPFAFVVQHWRPGAWGALRMGAHHGAYCVGCCLVLMLLLFAAGVMNLLWVAALSVLVLLQKVLPGGRLVSLATGAGMLAVGVWILAAR